MTQMHFSRWGDPAKAQPLSDSARGLIELFVGPIEERASVELADVVVPEVALSADHLAALARLVGTEYVVTDHDTRVRRTRGKSTPDLLRMRSGDASDAPDAVVRPAGHAEVAAVVRWCSD